MVTHNSKSDLPLVISFKIASSCSYSFIQIIKVYTRRYLCKTSPIIRFFECNYGTSGYPMDKMFGTFRDKLKESGTSYKGGSEEKVDTKTTSIHDRKASLSSKNKF